MLKTEYSWRFQKIFYFLIKFFIKKNLGENLNISTNDVISVKAAAEVLLS